MESLSKEHGAVLIGRISRFSFLTYRVKSWLVASLTGMLALLFLTTFISLFIVEFIALLLFRIWSPSDSFQEYNLLRENDNFINVLVVSIIVVIILLMIKFFNHCNSVRKLPVEVFYKNGKFWSLNVDRLMIEYQIYSYRWQGRDGIIMNRSNKLTLNPLINKLDLHDWIEMSIEK